MWHPSNVETRHFVHLAPQDSALAVTEADKFRVIYPNIQEFPCASTSAAASPHFSTAVPRAARHPLRRRIRSTFRSRASRCRTDSPSSSARITRRRSSRSASGITSARRTSRRGKTGFAHLFEHLMFQGSENHKDEFFRPFELAGATDQNGTTWFDRTNYFETVPTTALDMTLWMESDRMGHLLGAIGQNELDEQRGVVQNEKRQGENQPYGRVDERMVANVVSGESSVSPRHDRLDEGSRRRLARRRQAVVHDELRRRERDRRAGRRHHAGDRQGEDARILRRHSRRSAGAAPAAVDRAAHANRHATRWKITSRRRASTANGTCRGSAMRTKRSSSSPQPCSAAARPRVSTSASSTRTRSPTTSRSTCSRSRLPRCSSCRST